MSRKRDRKNKKEKVFSGYRGYPLIPPNKTHSNKKGPYNRKKELRQFLKDLDKEMYEK